MKWFKLALFEAYFNKGYAKLSHLTKILLLVGFADVLATGGDPTRVIIGGILYAIFCLFIGWLIFKVRYIDAELEVENKFNPFVREMREISGAFTKPKNI